MNKNYQTLEKEYSKFVGSKYAVSCNSGTSALHLGLLAFGVGKGDEVICPDFTMAACGFAISYTGATPIFIDCGDDLNIDVTKIESKVTKDTKAIMAVHIYGRLCNMKEIQRIAKKHSLWIIEDACEAQGAVYKSIADVTCYSFYQNKIIHAEEGGICTTDNLHLQYKMNYLKNMAFDKKHTYYHRDIGFNYRMPESQAKLALKSLKAYPENVKKRRKVEAIYNKMFGLTDKRDAVWVFDLKLPWKDKYKRVEGARHFFQPLSSMPMWGSFCTSPNALKMSKYFYLPGDRVVDIIL